MDTKSLKALKSSNIYVDHLSPPINGYLLLKGSKVQEVIPIEKMDLNMLKKSQYEIIDYQDLYIFPGFVDLNVHLNSTFDEAWTDVENTTKMAIQGGVTTIIDNPLMCNYSEDLDEKKALKLRIESLQNRIYTDTGLLAYLGPHNLQQLGRLWNEGNVVGFRSFLASSLQPGMPFFEAKHHEELKRGLATCAKYNVKVFLHCESATGRDLFTCSPLRSAKIEARLDLNVDIKDSSKFGGGIQGGMEDLSQSSNKSSSDSSDSDSSQDEEEKDAVGSLEKKTIGKNMGKINEISSGALRKKADKNAKLQDEQSIARLEIVGYAFNDEEKDVLNKLDNSVSELDYQNISSDFISSSDSEEEENTKKINSLSLSLSKQEYTEKKEIKVERIKKSKTQKKNNFVKNPLIGSLRSALGNLLESPSKIELPQKKDSPPGTDVETRPRHPSSLLQRRKLNGSPSIVSPTNNPPHKLSDFKISIKKSSQTEIQDNEKDLKINRNYKLFLSNHSLSWETNGVNTILTNLSEIFSDPSNNSSLILSNISNSNAAFLVRSKAKSLGYSLRIYCETSVPFLYFHMDQIQNGQAKFKCSPCIRDKVTRDLINDGLKLPHLFYAVSSFHLQVDKKYKKIEKGNFKRCFNGVSTIGSNLQVIWTKLYTRAKKLPQSSFEETLKQILFLLASSPAELAGLHSKGQIKPGYDADLVIWDPFAVCSYDSKNIHLRYPNLYLFKGQTFYGKVLHTYLRGCLVYSKGGEFVKAGRLLTRQETS